MLHQVYLQWTWLLTLEELGLGNPSISHVCTVRSTQPALYAFRKMEMLNHTALPIVDYESGSIIATISSSDIRFVAPDNMDEVLKPSLNFLNDVYSNNIQKPLTCTRNQKLSFKNYITRFFKYWLLQVI